MADYKVEYVTLSGGKNVPAEKLLCPKCKTLDLGTAIDTSVEPAVAVCPKCDTEWTFTTEADA
jgi:transcription elongation factor Elf1